MNEQTEEIRRAITANLKPGARGNCVPPPHLVESALAGVDQLPTARPIATAGEAARSAVVFLSRVQASGGSMDRQVASAHVHEILCVLAAPYRGFAAFRSGPVVTLGATVERWSSVARPPTLRIGNDPIFGAWWTAARVVLTGVSVCFLIGGYLDLAATLLTARILGSFLQPTPGLSADVLSDYTHGETKHRNVDWHVDWRACVIGQVCDLATLLAVAGYLMIQERTAWGAAVGLVALLEVFGTMVRVAAVQGGIVLRRLYLERLMRNGSLLLGVILATLLQPEVPTSGVPLIAIAAVGGGLYAVGEIVRVLQTSEAARRVDDHSTLDEMVWRRMANLLPVVERSVIADRSERPTSGTRPSEQTASGF